MSIRILVCSMLFSLSLFAQSVSVTDWASSSCILIIFQPYLPEIVFNSTVKSPMYRLCLGLACRVVCLILTGQSLFQTLGGCLVVAPKDCLHSQHSWYLPLESFIFIIVIYHCLLLEPIV